jgi:hypothetical protein
MLNINWTAFVPGIIILLIGVLIARAKSSGARLAGIIILAVGLLITLGAFAAIAGSLALTIALIVLAIGLLSLVGARSWVVKIIAILAAIFVILALLKIFNAFPSTTLPGQVISFFTNGINTLWRAIFQ